MTPPEHILIGFSIANIFFSVQKIFDRRRLPYLLIIIFATIFAVLPDIDSFFGNYASADVYIGHRGITHSIAFILLVSTACIPVAWICHTAMNPVRQSGREMKSCFAAFFLLLFLSGVSHLLADLPQPAGPWGGIPLFYPYQSNDVFIRSGGWAKLGWYDYRVMWTFIAASLVSAMAIVFIIFAERMKLDRAKKFLAAVLLAVNLGAHAWLVDHVRNSDYISASSWEKEQDEYLADSGPLISNLTIKGKKYFLKLFFSVR